MYLRNTLLTGVHGIGMESFGPLIFAPTQRHCIIVLGITTLILGAPTPALAKPALRLFKTEIAPL